MGMESFGKGFLTGFFNRTAEGIDKRKAEADDYFNKQMEIARNVGMQKRNQLDSDMKMGINAAKQLQQAGVPQDIVVGIAKQNPEDLSRFLTTVQELQQRGVKTDPDFFRKAVKVTGEVDPNETIESAFRKIYEPISSDPEATNQDPEGSIFAAMMGYSAMDNARRKLDTTKVVGDSTASDLIALEGFEPEFGQAVVTTDYGMIGNELSDLALAGEEADYARRQARKGAGGEKPLSIADRDKLNTNYMEVYDKNKKDIIDEHAEATGESLDWRQLVKDNPEAEREANQRSYDQLSEVFRPEDLSKIPAIAKWGIGSEGEEEAAPEEGGVAAPTTQEQYDALPSGTRYQHPDDPPGTTRVKR